VIDVMMSAVVQFFQFYSKKKTNKKFNRKSMRERVLFVVQEERGRQRARTSVFQKAFKHVRAQKSSARATFWPDKHSAALV
jgi:hypothetical protein